ncbi:unnamed protein product [Clonostachys solani]|uniref:Rhodopsin domain-containing protein n=1 Tax=Clonostachys solani TaxID=160281 RepID=A0A9N9ZAS8_9HYPO|nr:unnamed protein product [Clonostachys solani]
MDLLRDNFLKLSPEVQEAVLNSAGMPTPEGETRNLDDPPNGNKYVIALVSVSLSLTFTLGLLRMWVRTIQVKKWNIEDYLGFAAYGPYAGSVWVMVSCMHTGGFLVHQWNVRIGDLLDILYILIILRICYVLVMILAKSAIILEWTRIFVPRGTRNKFFWFSRAMLVFNIVAYVVLIIFSLISCVPIQKRWKPWAEGKCFWSAKSLDVTTAWVNLFIDVFILVLPQRIIWTLQLNTGRKIGISVIFSVGLIAVACAAGRTWSNMTLDYAGDTSYDASINTIWGWSEMTCVLIVFYAPGAAKAFTKQGVFHGMLSSLRSWRRLDGSKQSNYQSADSKGYPPVDTSSSQNLTATEMEVMRSHGHHRDAEVGFGDVGTGHGITRITKLETRVRSASNTSTDPVIEHQHPWMGDRR